HTVTLMVSQVGCHVGFGKTQSMSVDVPSGGTADVSFHVTCVTNGNLRVTVTTSGSHIPAAYPVIVDPGSVSVGVPANGAASMSLPPGSYTAGLTLPPNCIPNTA